MHVVSGRFTRLRRTGVALKVRLGRRGSLRQVCHGGGFGFRVLYGFGV